MQALIPERLETELNRLQQSILAERLPVLVIFEGSIGRVIGRVNSELIRCLEPRGVIYTHFDPAADGPRSMTDFLRRTPGKGQIGLFDRSWYSAMIELYGCEEQEELDRMLESYNGFERYLVRNGVLLIKIILKTTAAAAEEYGPQYGPAAEKTSFLSIDLTDPAKYREAMFEHIYERTDTEHAPWNKIIVRDIGETVTETAEAIIAAIKERLRAGPPTDVPREIDARYDDPRKDAECDAECERYDEVMNRLSEELGELQTDLSLSGRSLAVCFEGWDASGKGSCIKHLCHALNPRGYEVFQTKAPTEEESEHTYLWRFSRCVPEKGRITIFDRTWYGRMLVEHVEGFCTEEEYRRSPSEINVFERIMTENGTILLKFWLDITPGEQLKRFKKRAADPLKQWKITDEDWRNRAKWDEYEEHVGVMMRSTNTDHAPWTAVDSNDKKYARAKVLKTVVEALRKELTG
ncbi:MAG: hypothetical protein LBB30_05450 [Candidatus Methanoplasma sp.]|jgi:polyphosphate kinase 2 (PPK2 family)|nr:hypothetical protein [Candidatus Methanoplasma sp.]